MVDFDSLPFTREKREREKFSITITATVAKRHNAIPNNINIIRTMDATARPTKRISSKSLWIRHSSNF